MTTLCPCGRPTSAGRTEDEDAEQCLICEVAEAMQTFIYPTGSAPRPAEKTCQQGHLFTGPRCPVCKRLYDKRYRVRHPERFAVREREYKAAHRAEQRAYWRAYYQRNQDAMVERSKVYYQRKKLAILRGER